jgi:hypothetical protein
MIQKTLTIHIDLKEKNENLMGLVHEIGLFPSFCHSKKPIIVTARS